MTETKEAPPSAKRQSSGQQPQLPHAKRCNTHGSRSFDVGQLSDLRNAITLKGSATTEAILRGYKDVENRSVRLPVGWIALHNGKGSSEESLDLIMRRLAPGVPADADIPKGYVLGVCWVERAVKIDDLRAEFACAAACNDSKERGMRHIPSCTFTPHAGGPFCNVVSASIRLDNPVLCQGGRTLWKLPDDVRSAVLQQLLREPGPRVFDFRKDLQPAVEHLPRSWPCPWATNLTRADVYWHRGMVPEARPKQQTQKSGALRQFFRSQCPAAPPAEPAATDHRNLDHFFARPERRWGDSKLRRVDVARIDLDDSDS